MGRRPTISRDAAVRSALDIIDEQGLPALTLDAIAKRLGSTTPALYNHFSNRADLLAGVARHLLTDLPLPELPTHNDWRSQLIELCVETRHAILRHPHAAPLLLQFLPRRLLLPAYEHWGQIMISGGVPPAMLLPITKGLESLTYGTALFEAAAISERLSPFPQFEPTVYPAVATALDSNRQDPERMFRATLKGFLDGILQPHTSEERANV